MIIDSNTARKGITPSRLPTTSRLRPGRKRALITSGRADGTGRAHGMINLIAIVLGASLAVLFVGYLAISIDKIPLLVIVVLCLGLMAYSTYEDLRDALKSDR
jgi:hypothetical protein